MTDDSPHPRSSSDRRQFLKWASSVGLTAFAPNTVAEIAAAKDRTAETPDPYPRDGAESTKPTSDVYFTHVTEHDAVQRRIDSYEQTGTETELYHPHFQEYLSENPDVEQFDLAVNTVGERNTITSRGSYGRTLHGWRPTSEEVDRLAPFGDLAHVPEVISTKVSLGKVARKDLPRIASLDFVVGINVDPERVKPDGASADDLKNSNHFRFDLAEYCYAISNNVDIGILDDGYDGSGRSEYDESYAETIGINDSLANDFTDENDWSDVTYRNDDDELVYHGDNVADSAAYMLKDADTHGDLFVPMKVASENESYHASNARAAIEYATTHDIDVINMSFSGDPQSTCPSTYCEELNAYTDSGYIPFGTTGNNGNEYSVGIPGGEWFTIGVGGFDANCSNGADYKRDTNSNYGTVVFYNRDFNVTYCSWCHSHCSTNKQFSPHVYGCYETDTSNGTLYGTSFASPQVAAGGVVFRSEAYLDFDEAQQRFRNMNTHTICGDESTDPAEEGQLLDVYDLVDC